MAEVGDLLVISSNKFGHRFPIGTEVRVFRKIDRVTVDACNSTTGDCCIINVADVLPITLKTLVKINKIDNSMKLMKKAVLDTATRLCKANNTVSTLEIKTELRKTHPYFHWIQNTRGTLIGVSEFMDELYQEGRFVYTDNGQFRVYSLVQTVKPTAKRGRPRKTTATPVIAKKVKNPNHNVRSISRQKALDLMANNKGHFFTAVFVKQDGSDRTINCQYMKGQTANPLGYVMVKETGKLKVGDNPIRQINIQTLKHLRIGGQNFNIRK